MKSFKEFLTLLSEGGNIAFGDKQAERIDLSKISRDELVPKLKKLLIAINKEFKKLYSFDLWSKELLQSGKFLSGSAFHLFDTDNIPSEKFVSNKPTVGDIDLQVDHLQRNHIQDFLYKIKGKRIDIGTLFDFKPSVSGQLISLWEVEVAKNTILNIQFDFEMVEYLNNEPSEWSGFSHSSNWNDITKKIKGAFHKLLLRAITNKDNYPFIEVMKSKEKVVEDSNILTFSVEKGLRSKYEPIINAASGEQEKNEDGLPKFRKLATKDSKYETNLSTLIRILFNLEKKPTATDYENFKSFTGLIKLIKTYVKSEEQKQRIINRFLELLFGKSAQGLYKNDPVKDKEEKMVAVDYILKELGKSLSEEDNIQMKHFYDNYRMFTKDVEG